LLVSASIACGNVLPAAADEDASDLHHVDVRGEFSRILRQEPASFYRILRKPTFSRIMRDAGENEATDSDAFKRQSFSRILRSGFTRIQRPSDDADSDDGEVRDGRASALSRIMRSNDFSRIL
jgi:histone H3/H4